MPSAKDSGITVLPLGALIQEFRVNGHNIVQNFPTAELYKKYNAPYFGETIGRVANRISGAKINRLNGKSYSLPANNGPNSLHGGNSGWGKKEWEGPKADHRNGKDSILYQYVSPDGDEGYPGKVEAKVWYISRIENVDGKEMVVCEMEYEAELTGGDVEETVIAMTNHSYFNLTGDPTIEGTRVTLATNQYQVVDKGGIPQGPIEAYPGIKANETFTLGAEEPDVDDCFIYETDPSKVPIDTRGLPMRKLASVYHPQTKIHLEAISTEPAFQFYTGRFINVPEVDGLPARGPRSAFCLEASRYVNAVNTDEYRGMVTLKKGQKYGSRTLYRAWQD